MWNPAFKVRSSELVEAFSAHIKRKVDVHFAFPKLMRQVMTVEPRITREQDKRAPFAVWYRGVRLQAPAISRNRIMPTVTPSTSIRRLGRPALSDVTIKLA